MKISVITITSRQAPRLDAAAKTLAASLSRVSGDVELEWIIVDELGRDPEALVQLEGFWKGAIKPHMKISSILPLPSVQRDAPERLPAHNSARNAGLLVAEGDYIVLLNDCNLVTCDWVALARDVAAAGKGWKCKTHSLVDMPVPEHGVVRYRDHHDLLHAVPYMTVAGTCWGAPRAAFEQIRGFDQMYDGQRKGNDVEAIVRLARVGVQFVTSERAFTIELRRTKHQSEITTNREAMKGVKNSARLVDLQRDRNRIHPHRSAYGNQLEGERAPRQMSPLAFDVLGAQGSTLSGPPAAVPTRVEGHPAGAVIENGRGAPLTETENDLANEFDTGDIGA